MGSGDRFLIFLTSLLLVAAALVLGLAAARVYLVLQQGMVFANLHIPGNWQAGVAALLLLLMGLRLGYLAFARERQGQMLVQKSDLGEVSIALAAIENLVQRTARQVPGVREVRSRVAAKPEGLAVRLQAWVGNDANVPELGARLQEAVRQRLQEVISVDATAISVAVKDIGSEPRLKVR